MRLEPPTTEGRTASRNTQYRLRTWSPMVVATSSYPNLSLTIRSRLRVLAAETTPHRLNRAIGVDRGSYGMRCEKLQFES